MTRRRRRQGDDGPCTLALPGGVVLTGRLEGGRPVGAWREERPGGVYRAGVLHDACGCLVPWARMSGWLETCADGDGASRMVALWSRGRPVGPARQWVEDATQLAWDVAHGADGRIEAGFYPGRGACPNPECGRLHALEVYVASGGAGGLRIARIDGAPMTMPGGGRPGPDAPATRAFFALRSPEAERWMRCLDASRTLLARRMRTGRMGSAGPQRRQMRLLDAVVAAKHALDATPEGRRFKAAEEAAFVAALRRAG